MRGFVRRDRDEIHTVRGLRALNRIIPVLARRGFRFAVEPLPDDLYEVTTSEGVTLPILLEGER